MRFWFFILLTFPMHAIDFSADISPIIYENCTSCHRSGQIASFLPLTNYEEVFDNRFWIAYAIEGDEDETRHGEPLMPPWPADRSYSTLLDDSKIRSATGVGFDWFTPIGPLTFSLAFPLIKEHTDETETLRFNIGTSF